MTSNAPPPLSDVPAGVEPKDETMAPPLGAVAASGFTWTLVLTVLTRCISFASYIVLARLLLKSDFGAYYQAFITISLISALRDNAITLLLIARQQELDRLESDGFWISLGIGVVSMAIIAAVGGIYWFQPEGKTVAWLLWMNALASPLMNVGTVSNAKMQIQMHFRALAKIGMINHTTTTGLSILLAWAGWGPYALMVPQVALGIARSFYFYWLLPPRVSWPINRGIVWTLLVGSAMVAYSMFCNQVVGQGDNFIVSLRFDQSTVGLYGWAFNLSVQTLLLLSMSLGAVILPTLSRLNDEPRRQAAAYVRLSRTLAVVGVPFCFLQILFAQPIVKPLFGVRWQGAEVLLQILSLAMAFGMITGFNTQIMIARKHNRLLVGFGTVSMIAFMSLVYLGVRLGGVAGVAWGVVAYHALIGTAGMRLAIGKHGRVRDILHIFWPPLLAAVIAAMPTMSMALLMPRVYRGDAALPITLVSIAAFATLFAVLYAVAIRWLAPEPWRELLERLDGLTRRAGFHLV